MTIAVAERVGTPRLVEVQTAAAQHFYEHGDWDQSLFYVARSRPVTPYQGWPATGSARSCHAHRDDRAAAEEQLRGVSDVDYASRVDFLIAAKAVIVRPGSGWRRCRAMRGGDRILSAWLDPRVDDNPHARAERCDVFPLIVRAALARGDRTPRGPPSPGPRPTGAPTAIPSRRVTPAICRPCSTGDPGPLLAGGRTFPRGGRPLVAAAFTTEEAARPAGRAGRRGGARSRVQPGHGRVRRLGAAADLQRLRSRLRPYGIRPGPRTAHRRAAAGWDSLTEAEEKVVMRVAEGLSNPEIASRLSISRRTVETHVAHVLRKLDLRSRRDIMLAVQGRGTVHTATLTAVGARPPGGRGAYGGRSWAKPGTAGPR